MKTKRKLSLCGLLVATLMPQHLQQRCATFFELSLESFPDCSLTTFIETKLSWQPLSNMSLSVNIVTWP